MAATKLKLEIEQGADFTRVLTWKNKATDIPVDLTGATARMHVRSTIKAPTPLLVLTTENNRIFLGGTAGTITLDLSAEITAGLTWLSGVYDLEIVFPTGRVRRLLKGSITVSQEVTRA